MVDEPPFKTVIIYNQSRHASNSILSEMKNVWGNKLNIVMVIEEGLQPPLGVDHAIYIKAKDWGNMDVFKERLDYFETQDKFFHSQLKSKEVAFMPGWSAFAEA